MARLELAPYRSTSPRVQEIWDAYDKDHRAWVRRVRKAEKTMAELQGRPGERASAWVRGGANDSRHQIIGFSHLRLPREDGEPTWRLTKHCPEPPGWRHLVDDDYLTPLPENGRKGGDPKGPEAVAARELMASVQPPKTIASRFEGEFGMPIIVWAHEESRIYFPAMEPITTDAGWLLLVCWSTSHKNVAESAGRKRGNWTGGGAFEPIKPSEYYALKGQ